ncbi:hypothetical protein M7I_1484 [Glarea lozoyensis 74030]|uniref:Uncharacterized protein n=1 Tax=Glarea lozoyensis (strain ATCC 74030 / MF5533) TaxID=1104152 RepID=H0EG74_GLAL7|nr:hypothetical protein M7I_1484 [Glarea lozoyensis 74030]
MKPTYSWSHLQGVTTHDLLDTSPELPCPSVTDCGVRGWGGFEMCGGIDEVVEEK